MAPVALATICVSSLACGSGPSDYKASNTPYGRRDSDIRVSRLENFTTAGQASVEGTSGVACTPPNRTSDATRGLPIVTADWTDCATAAAAAAVNTSFASLVLSQDDEESTSSREFGLTDSVVDISDEEEGSEVEKGQERGEGEEWAEEAKEESRAGTSP